MKIEFRAIHLLVATFLQIAIFTGIPASSVEKFFTEENIPDQALEQLSQRLGLSKSEISDYLALRRNKEQVRLVEIERIDRMRRGDIVPCLSILGFRSAEFFQLAELSHLEISKLEGWLTVSTQISQDDKETITSFTGLIREDLELAATLRRNDWEVETGLRNELQQMSRSSFKKDNSTETILVAIA